MLSQKKTLSKRLARIRIPVEVLIGIVLLIGIISVGYIVVKQAVHPLPTEEICDLQDNDLDGEIDEGFSVTCTVDSQCGPNGVFGEEYCKNGDVYRAGYESKCVGKKDSCMSECANKQVEVLVKDCPDGCLKGRCVGN